MTDQTPEPQIVYVRRAPMTKRTKLILKLAVAAIIVLVLMIANYQSQQSAEKATKQIEQSQIEGDKALDEYSRLLEERYAR